MRIRTGEADEGTRLDRFLASVVEIGSRSKAEKLLQGEHIRIDGDLVPKSYRLKGGETIEIADEAIAPPAPRSHAGGRIPVIYEDDQVMVVNKPSGIVVHPAPGHRAVTLVEMLTEDGVNLAPSDDDRMFRPGVVHRLDRDTSGVMILAKTPEALRAMQESIRSRTTKREYLALVQGHVPSRAGRIEAPIGADSQDHSRRSLDTDKPQEAITHFVVEEVLPDTTLVRVKLETGRTHQIRVHFDAIGHPVIADATYGNAPDLGLTRQFLHAAKLRFPHPETGEEIEVTAPLPDALKQALMVAREKPPQR